MDEVKKRQGIQSIEVGFRVLKCLEEANEPLSISDLSRRLDMSGSKVHKYLVSFCRVGMIQQNERDSSYSLGPRLIAFGLAALRNIDVVKMAADQMLEIRQQLNETVGLSLWGESGPYFVKWQQSNRLINFNINVGSNVPLTTSSTGKVFAAYLPRERTQGLLEREFRQKGIDIEKYRNELNQIVMQGYSYTNEELVPGLVAISAPIFDHNKEITAAITIIGSSSSMDSSVLTKSVLLLKQATEQISRQLSFGF